MKNYIIRIDDYSEYVSVLRGIFNLTPTEGDQMISLTALVNENGEIDYNVRQTWGSNIGLPTQSVRNKLTILRKKGAVIGNKIHPFFYTNPIGITIQYESTEVNSEKSS